MAYIKDNTGNLHKSHGLCEECGNVGTYVRAVRIKGWQRTAAIYACTVHRGDEWAAGK
ncbi:hypothetical protein CPT_Sycamore_046 [Streptomyces phage Sycamore]|uniref:Uncharacterized protein n=1 Tax=Streptomyces phage Sycamore TaxID=2767589 RepID=A0A873WJC2_9CAUD|nr:hypothetical protein CPT_Sycamore_046 [Streptomyces phage Sycamore]